MSQLASVNHEDKEALVERLAATQSVVPVTAIESLWGDFWPEAESVDDFVATVREWRRADAEGQHASRPS